MAGTTSRRGPSRRGRRGLRRGSLTPELIVKESLKLLDDKGLDGFSMPKLGRALGADPTAVYRHFASKDDLVLAIADQLIEDAMAGLAPHACWVDTVTDIVRRTRRTYCDHPAAASLAACRTTQRPAEMRIADTLIGAILDAGFEGRTAAQVYRAIADFSLAGPAAKPRSTHWKPACRKKTGRHGCARTSRSTALNTGTSGSYGRNCQLSPMTTFSRRSCHW